MCLDKNQLLLQPETYCRSEAHKKQAINSWTNVFPAETEAKLTHGTLIKLNKK